MNFNIDYSTKVILRVVLILSLLALLWVLRDIVIIVLLALVLASAMEPVVDYLNRKKIPRTVSVLSAYSIFLIIIGLVIAKLAPIIVEQAQLLSQNLPQYVAGLQSRYPWLSGVVGQNGINNFLESTLAASGNSASIFNRTVGLVNGAFAGITVLVLSFYLVAADRGMKNFVRDLLPPSQQSFIIGLIEKIQRKMGMWLVGQLILSIFIFALTYIGLSLLGVQYALFLALLAGILEIMPYIGPFLSAVPAVFFAFIQSPTLAIAVIVLYILIQKTEGYILVPKVMQKTIGTSPLVVLLALLIGFKLGGILGLLLAVPLAGAVTAVLQELYPKQTHALEHPH